MIQFRDLDMKKSIKTRCKLKKYKYYYEQKVFYRGVGFDPVSTIQSYLEIQFGGSFSNGTPVISKIVDTGNQILVDCTRGYFKRYTYTETIDWSVYK